MNETYVGWDGKSYPWPPPEGWYEAIDGRWWALGTGPNPPPQGAGIQQPGAQPLADSAQPVTPAPSADGFDPQATQVGSVATDNTNPMPTYAQDPSQATPAVAAAAAAAYQAGGAAPPQTPATVNYGFEEGPPVNPNDFGEAPRSGGGIFRSLMIIVGMVVVALGGGLAYFYLTADEAPEETTTSTPDGTSDTTPSTDTTTATDPTGSTDTTDGDSSETTAPDASSSTVLTDDEASLETFRSILADNGLTSADLPDDEIVNFARGFCDMATAAADEDAFDDIRDSAVEATTSALSNRELRLVIDAAILSFCPDEATRLDISV